MKFAPFNIRVIGFELIEQRGYKHFVVLAFVRYRS